MAKSCYEYAMDVLSKYPKTEKELRIKMYQHGYDSQMVMKTLEKLKVENFLKREAAFSCPTKIDNERN